MRNRLISWLLAALSTCASLPAPAVAAEDPLAGDIRDLKVGLTVEELPREGYVWFACGRNGISRGVAIEGWHDYRRCPPDEQGWHEVSFKYDDSRQEFAAANDDWRGTKMAGHPVVLSLLINDDGMVQGLRAITAAQGHYERKKAFLLGIRVMGRYGREGWSCRDAPPGDRAPVGGLFIDRVCEKALEGRRIYLHTALYRLPRQREPIFTGQTRLEILREPATTPQ